VTSRIYQCCVREQLVFVLVALFYSAVALLFKWQCNRKNARRCAQCVGRGAKCVVPCSIDWSNRWLERRKSHQRSKCALVERRGAKDGRRGDWAWICEEVVIVGVLVV
jgi:hypothetical protein